MLMVLCRCQKKILDLFQILGSFFPMSSAIGFLILLHTEDFRNRGILEVNFSLMKTGIPATITTLAGGKLA